MAGYDRWENGVVWQGMIGVGKRYGMARYDRWKNDVVWQGIIGRKTLWYGKV